MVSALLMKFACLVPSSCSYFEKGCRKNVHAAIPQGDMGYDQYTVPDTVAVEPTFVAFLWHLQTYVEPTFVAFLWHLQTYVRGFSYHSFKFL